LGDSGHHGDGNQKQSSKVQMNGTAGQAGDAKDSDKKKEKKKSKKSKNAAGD
jgi:hypothetical protein